MSETDKHLTTTQNTNDDRGFELITNLSRDFSLSVETVGELLGIHPHTLERRQKSGTLEEAELLKAQMLDETFDLATTAFHEPEKARDWLFSEVAALEFKRPVDMLTTITGYERVKALLGKIIFGVY